VNIDLKQGLDNSDRFHPDLFTAATQQFFRVCKKKMKHGVKIKRGRANQVPMGVPVWLTGEPVRCDLFS
jgi:hypothetical protein